MAECVKVCLCILHTAGGVQVVKAKARAGPTVGECMDEHHLHAMNCAWLYV